MGCDCVTQWSQKPVFQVIAIETRVGFWARSPVPTTARWRYISLVTPEYGNNLTLMNACAKLLSSTARSVVGKPIPACAQVPESLEALVQSYANVGSSASGLSICACC